MKLKNCMVIFLILVMALPLMAQVQTDAAKMFSYQNQKKNPTTAGLLSCCLTSSGHFYAGNWQRGLMFTAGRMAGSFIAITMGFEEKTVDNGWYEETTIEITPMYSLGMGISVGVAIWEIFDATAEAKRYNEKLYESIFGEKMPYNMGMNVTPLKDGAVLNFAYNF